MSITKIRELFSLPNVHYAAFYDLQWTLLRLVESMVKYENEVNYLHLISQCPSEEWRNAMMDRYKNWKKTNSKEK